MSTPHIAAAAGEIAERVIMPGDPRRAERIAREHLDDARLVTDVRGILGFTGTVGGVPVTVMASGMGMPSITIYATELARHYGVRSIVRVGTTGAIHPEARIRDVVIATHAHTDSSMTELRVPGVQFSHVADQALARLAVDAGAAITAAEARDGAAIRVGAVFTTDHFYLDRPELHARLADLGTWCVEMEAAGLYAVGAAEGVSTLAVLTVTDHLLTDEHLSAHERESGFQRALGIAFAALGLDD